MRTRSLSNQSSDGCESRYPPSPLSLPKHFGPGPLRLTFDSRAALHHPDKFSDPSQAAVAENFYVRLKNAQDTLSHPAKKYAYDRFGPEISAWQNVTSIRDYLIFGLQACIPIYLGGVIVMVLLAFTGYLQWGRYVRDPFITAAMTAR